MPGQGEAGLCQPSPSTVRALHLAAMACVTLLCFVLRRRQSVGKAAGLCRTRSWSECGGRAGAVIPLQHP